MLPAEVLVDTSLGKGLVRVPVVIDLVGGGEVPQDGDRLDDVVPVVLNHWDRLKRVDFGAIFCLVLQLRKIY